LRSSLLLTNCLHYFAYISLGQNLALIEIITVVTALLREFKFELLPDQISPNFAETLTLRMKEPLLANIYFRSV